MMPSAAPLGAGKGIQQVSMILADYLRMGGRTGEIWEGGLVRLRATTKTYP